MKQKPIKQIANSQIFFNKKKSVDFNNKKRLSNINNINSTINNTNIRFTELNEIPYCNSSIKNLSFKTKLKKFLSNRDFYNKSQTNKDKYYHKKIISEKTMNGICQESKNNQNDILVEESTTNYEENQNKDYNQTFSDIKNDKKEHIGINQEITPIKAITSTKNRNKNKIKYIKKCKNINIKSRMNSLNINGNNNLKNKTMNELDNNKNINDDINIKNNDKTQNNIELEIGGYFDGGLKEKMKNKLNKKIDDLNIEKVDSHLVKDKEKKLKKNNNILLLNLKDNNINDIIKDNRTCTPSEKAISMKNGLLKILEFFKNKKNEKILLKHNEKKEKEKFNEVINEDNEINEKKEENKKEEEEEKEKEKEDTQNNEKNEYNGDKENKTSNNNDNNNILKNKKDKIHNKNIFNEIIEEVKEEKNYIQKIVHRKLMQNIKDINKFNNSSKLNEKYTTMTYKNKKILDKKTPTSNNLFLKKHTKDLSLNNTKIFPRLFSDKKERNNNKYLNIHIQDFQNMNKCYERYKTYNNICKSNDNIKVDDFDKYKEYKKVKIKKIKLDKLKYKLKRNTTDYYKNENTNANLKKKLNQKIYTPKKASISKKKIIESLTIPVNCSYYQDHRHSKIPALCSQNDDFNSVMYTNNIKPLNEITITELDNNMNYHHNNYNNNKINNAASMFQLRISPKNSNIINNNNNTINFYNNNNINNYKDNLNNINTYKNIVNRNVKKVKTILYSKAKIKKKNCISYNKDYITNRSGTIKYIKKIKNKKEKEKEKPNNKVNKTINKANENIIIKTQEIQFDALSKRTSLKTINNLDKTEQTNFNINNRSINSMNLTNEKTEKSNININEYRKKNPSNLSQIYSLSGEGFDNNLSYKKCDTDINRLKYNFSYDIAKNTINGIDDVNNENSEFEKIINLLSFEDLLIIEDRFNLILSVLEKGNHTYEEYFSLWYYYYSSSIKLKLEQIYIYFPKETKCIKAFINYSLIFILICYDFAANNINLGNDNSFNLNEIAQLIYTNLLIIIFLIKSKILLNNKDNYYIRLIELSKIEITLKNKLSNFENDYLFSREILHNNSNLIIKKITSIIDSNLLNNISKKYNSEIFTKIKTCTFEEINNFFLEKVLKESFLGCSVLAYTFLKENPKFIQPITPYLRIQNKKKYTLVLDLDETLIHFKVNHDESEEGMLRLRPGVFNFLEKVGEYYEIILFTEASEAYTKLILEAFNNDKKKKKYFDYKLYRQHTSIDGQDFVKDLTKVGRPLDKTIIIDNIAQNFKLQKNNGIIIKPFLGVDQNDQALIDLIPILINIARDEIDVRNGLMKYRDEILTKISSNLFMRYKQK